MTNNKCRIAVFVSGRGTNLSALIDAVRAGEIDAEIALVVTENPRATALDRAASAGIPIRVLPPGDYPDRYSWNRGCEEAVVSAECSLVILAGFMRILDEEFVQRFEGRIINIHPSLLPEFPGATAVADALASESPVGGCTTHFVDEGVDTGPVIFQETMSFQPDDNVQIFGERLRPLEHGLLIKTVAAWLDGRVKLVDGTVEHHGERTE